MMRQAVSIRHWRSPDFGPRRGMSVVLDEAPDGTFQLYTFDARAPMTCKHFTDTATALAAYERAVAIRALKDTPA